MRLRDFDELIDALYKYKTKTAYSWIQNNQLVSCTYEEFVKDVMMGKLYFKRIMTTIDTCILVAERSYEWYVLFFSMLTAGIGVIPISSLEEQEDYEELNISNYMVYSKEKAILAHKIHEKNKDIHIECTAELLNQIRNRVVEEVDIQNEKVGHIYFYSSGTTGKHKLAKISQQAFMYCVNGIMQVVDYLDDSKYVSFLPVDHVYDLVVSLYAMMIGSNHFILRSSSSFKRECKIFKPTVVAMVPIQITALLSKPESIKENGFEDIELIVSGGSALEQDITDRISQRGTRIIQGYGCTECPVISVNDNKRYNSNCEGIILKGTDIVIKDERIYVKSRGLFERYIGDSSESRDTEGYFPTGDLGEISDDGKRLKLIGRANSIIVLSNGLKVNPESIEKIIEKSKMIEAAVVSKMEGKDILQVMIYTKQSEKDIESEANIKDIISKINLSLPYHQKIGKVELYYNAEVFNKMGKKSRGGV